MNTTEAMSDKKALQAEFLHRVAPVIGFNPADPQQVAEVFMAIDLIIRNHDRLRRYVENADLIDSLIEEYGIDELVL